MTAPGDAVVDLVGFARWLRDNGVQADVSRVAAALRALAAYPTLGDGDVYWACRLTLCGRRDDLAVFDRLFAAWFGIAPPDPVTPIPRPRTGDQPGATDGDAADGDRDAAEETARASLVERLAVTTPWTLSAADRAEAVAFLDAFTRTVPLRRTMRHRPGGRATVDVARTVATMMRHGGEPVRLWYRRPAQARRRLVLLVDVSESLDAHRERLLRFAYAAVAAAPATTEVFTIGTRLDRITAHIGLSDPQRAIDALAGRRVDWNGGTRLRETITAFTATWGGHRMTRSADVVIVSDGWGEFGDTSTFVTQIARLTRLAHRVVWADPTSGEPGYAPMAPMLRDSLPHVHLVAGHDADALCALAELVTRTSGRDTRA